jgi:hypothetical protein
MVKRLELVIWEDASNASDEWVKIEECDFSLSAAETQGRLVHEDERSITLAQSTSEGEVRGIMTIPKGTIIDRLWGERLIEKIREEMAENAPK